MSENRKLSEIPGFPRGKKMKKKNPSSTHFLPHLSSAFQWSSRSNFAFQTLAQLRFTPSHLWTRHVKSPTVKSFGSGINHHLQDVWLQRCRINQNQQQPYQCLDVQGYWTIIQLDEVDLAFVCLHQAATSHTTTTQKQGCCWLQHWSSGPLGLSSPSRKHWPQVLHWPHGLDGLDILDGFLWFLQVNGPFVQPCSCPYHQQLQCAWSQCGRPHNCCSLAMWISEAEHGICSVKPSDPTYTYQRYTKKNICYRHHHTKQCFCLLLLLTQQLRQLQNVHGCTIHHGGGCYWGGWLCSCLDDRCLHRCLGGLVAPGGRNEIIWSLWLTKNTNNMKTHVVRML